jgi:hypothetical protein
MTSTIMRRDQTEDQNIFTHDISDEVLEAAADTTGEKVGNITWAHCSALTLCRFEPS